MCDKVCGLMIFLDGKLFILGELWIKMVILLEKEV